MKVVIFGSRSITSDYLVERAIQECGFDIEEIIVGDAQGVDTLAWRYARRNNVPYRRFEAAWQEHPERHITKDGHSYDPLAGHERNEIMAKEADAGVGIWDNKSTGTKDMMDRLRALGKPVRILREVRKDEECGLV